MRKCSKQQPRLLRSTQLGVTCHPHTRRRRRRAFDLPRYRTVTPLRTPERHPLPDRNSQPSRNATTGYSARRPGLSLISSGLILCAFLFAGYMHLDFVRPDRWLLPAPEVRPLAELAWYRAYVLNLNEVG